MLHAERDLALSELRERIGGLEKLVGKRPYVPCASSGAFTPILQSSAYATSRRAARHWAG